MALVIPRGGSIVRKRLITLLLTLSTVAFCGYVHHQVSLKVKNPYIDEYFHIRQCQKYCQHKFHEWDNKITTPPGLYVLGFLYTNAIQKLSGAESNYYCGNYDILRSVNLLGFFALLAIAHRFKKSYGNQYLSINIASQPLLFTYYFLFYTDIWSTVFVVLALTIVMSKPVRDYQAYCSGLLGLLSLWFRQTNIVWVAFILAVLVERSVVRKRGESPNFLAQTSSFISSFFKNWFKIIPFVINAVLFAIFLKINGGITFGDKENHEIQLHVVQVFYCFTFIVLFTWPVWFDVHCLKRYLKFVFVQNYGLNFGLNVVSLCAIKYVIDNFTVVHPFLLADNRHYTFYIFKRLISHPKSYIIAVPLYHFATYSIISSLSQSDKINMRFVTIVCYLAAVCLTIIPSPLFEPRYYIVPLVIFRLFIKPVNTKRHYLEFIWLNTINVVTTLVFLNYEFTWASEPGSIQRIIW
ncbi:glucosyltransferase [Scheffersomyces stipitis CBS 6054]|uniref:Dol-P-Glc:Glc(2)Man(9)GlcNAc(2)-PP-Dol alpha-1,2-glucosyltransferase n=1 Tax=Scheffersomyces stipitis (strain ATCC 58785 / CBS 6054 / NBRC 10063 / NRRL Y-11545) TaxID=322104 RepID=A3LRZ3_PICST|nr:glucosyltransferase [Scheffersomyces stipitis CBS 6054]ABN65819.2 glucosyltransferase [Scheffersomyces stipitis CBS 6054]KAG2733930.1 hypothetical protein G9P44_003455 [Scheffersomyces stipitis]